VDEILSRGITQMLDLQSTGEELGSGEAIVSLLDRMEQEHKRTSELLGLPTGVPVLDQMTRGMQPAELFMVGARTGVGKSAFMLQTAIANARVGNGVLIFSLEMTQEQIFRRIFASIAGVAFCRVRDPKWATEQEMSGIRYAASQVTDWPLQIDPSGAMHGDQIVAKARHAIRRRGVKLVAVDYAQIVPADGRDERLRVAAVSRGLTRLAKDEGVPVLLLSQLARPDRSNTTKRPRLSDLRETSQLENDANVVVLLHRPVDEDDQLGSDAELIIAKQRSGATGIFTLEFNQTTLTFEPRKNSRGR
jgi:replicative DNA helicase